MIAASRFAGWQAAARVYADRRVLAMVCLGFASGLPYGAVVGAPLTAWLAESGISKTGIGLFVLVGLPYTVKFLFAPFIDRLPLPGLTGRLGRRRGWALIAQVGVLMMLICLGLSPPDERLLWTAVFATAAAFASACQDVVVDAYRVEILEESKAAAGAATLVFGYRIGLLFAGAGGLMLADLVPWSVVFTVLALAMVVGMITIVLNPEPRPLLAAALENQHKAEAFLERNQGLPKPLAEALAWLYASALCPLLEFIGRRGWITIIAFIFLYKFGDAVLSVMRTPFLLELGFTKTTIAEVDKLFGFFAIIAGGLLGGLLLTRIGLMRGLLICGVLMALSNLMFVVQALVGASVPVLALTVAVENLTTGMGTTAFVAFLTSLCNVNYTATQYALLSSVMGFSRTVMSSGAGWLADQVDWPTFFVLTTIAAVPGLVLLVWMMRTAPTAEASPDTG